MKKLYVFICLVVCAIALYAGVVQSTWTTTSDATTARNGLAAIANANGVCTNQTNYGNQIVAGNLTVSGNVDFLAGSSITSVSNIFCRGVFTTPNGYWGIDRLGNAEFETVSVNGDAHIYGTLFAAIHTIKFFDVVTNEDETITTNTYDGMSFDTNNNRMRFQTNAVFEGTSTFTGEQFLENLAGLGNRILSVEDTGHIAAINETLNETDVLNGYGSFVPIADILPAITTNDLPGFLPQWSETDPGSLAGGGNPFTNSPSSTTNIPAFDEMVTNGNTMAFLVATVHMANIDGSGAAIALHGWLDSTNNVVVGMGPGTGFNTTSDQTISYLVNPGEIVWLSNVDDPDSGQNAIVGWIWKQFP